MARKPQKRKYRFSGEEAKGTVTVSKGAYGLEIDVTEGGTKWAFMVDLFHLSPGSNGKDGYGDDTTGIVQVCVYNPIDLEGDPLAHVRVSRDGKLKVVGP